MQTLERAGTAVVERVIHRLRALIPTPAQAAWALPFFVFFGYRFLGEGRVTLLIGLVVAVGTLVLIGRHPSRALLVLIAVMPFQLILLAFLYRMGVPGGLVRALGAYRDVIAAGLALAAVREFKRSGKRLDGLDRLAIAYILLVTLYLLAPRLFVRPPSLVFPGPPEQLDIRFLAYRVDVMFVVLFLAIRHGRFPPEIRDRLVRVLLVTGAIVAGVAVFEFLFDATWDRFCVETLQVPRYWVEVLDYPDTYRTTTVLSHITVAGRELVRPGSVFIDPLHLGFFLLLPFAAAVELIIRQKARASYLVAGLVGVGLLFANVRSAQLGAVVIGFLATRPAPGRDVRNRIRFLFVLAAGGLLLLPAAASSSFTSRTAAISQSEDTSTNAHLNSLEQGVSALGKYPLGLGLGSQPGVGSRFAVKTRITSENSYIGVGNELGVPTMVVFVLLVVVMLRRLKRARDDDSDALFSSAVRGAAIALSIGALFLHAWLYYAATATLWGLAGLTVGLHDRSRATRPRVGPVS